MTTTRTSPSLNTRIDSLDAAAKSDTYIGQKGAEIFHDLMRHHGVRQIFGYPGGAILPVFDAIYDAETFDFILTRASAARQMVVCRR